MHRGSDQKPADRDSSELIGFTDAVIRFRNPTSYDDKQSIVLEFFIIILYFIFYKIDKYFIQDQWDLNPYMTVSKTAALTGFGYDPF